jgi:uncharacterized protein
MLELRPNCENCNVSLAPSSTQARICSFECTFCAKCVDEVLGDVCPNCGGGFSPRPVRPSRDWKGGNCLGNHPASSTNRHHPVDPEAHRRFADAVRGVPPERR